jgi:hypothetical protein
MKFLYSALAAFLLTAGILPAASLDNHPHWRSEKLPDLYYEVLSSSLEQAIELQAPDGRYRTRLPSPADPDETGWRVTWMQYIYAPALLYVTENGANSFHGSKAALECAIAAGDYLASIVEADGSVLPRVNGKPTNPLDAHRTVYCWTEAFALLRPHLDNERTTRWAAALKRAGELIAESEVFSKIHRPKYTSPFLGFSPNHLGLRATTVYRLGMVLDIPEWVERTEPALIRFVQHIRPGGYWEEHNGPTMSYDYLNVSVAGLLWHYSSHPDAMRAMRINTDFHTHWTTPDGIDIHTVDQRNRNHFSPLAAYGLFAFSHFPDGRRYARFRLLTTLGDGNKPLQAKGLEALARIAQSAHYHVDGEEATIPQQLPSYHHALDRPAVVRKSGGWVYSMSALVSPERPKSQFYMDRIVPVSLWNIATGAIIGGGNSKGQPQLATFAVHCSDGQWSYLPLDALIRGSFDADTMCVAHEGFSLRFTFNIENDSHATVRAQAEFTYDRPDTAYLHIPLVMHPGGTLDTGEGGSFTLDEQPLEITGGKRISHNGWSALLPAAATLTWPFYTYHPYGSVRVPKNIHNAQAVLAVPLTNDGEWVEVKFRVN